MSGVSHIKIYVQAALYEQVPTFHVHIYFYIAELLLKNNKIQKRSGKNVL